ncbi:Cell filamentation protein fic [Desulfosporosinus sp. I2]|uniref:Fic/DOC family protein n=1 Tax=Desulfosporosinus sp. I2 TaxID=1617025 RepID=UPI0005EFE95F|nr:Fic family protein [Desulfosporosinus sp. I2]KJR47380.1 Cell filamentation protein fic [Desulfosporosinus sp. I2]
MGQFEYCYPGTDILKNKLGIRDSEKLHDMERGLTFFRLAALEKNPIQGNFDLPHLKKIHHYIFQDIYDWAGQIRVVNIAKGNSVFALQQFIEPLCNGLFRQLKKEDHLKDLGFDKFSDRLAFYTSEINAYHPFREGNGRSTREFIRCLAKEAGYVLNYSEFNSRQLMGAYISSFKENNLMLANIYKENLRSNFQERENLSTGNEREWEIRNDQEIEDDWENEL